MGASTEIFFVDSGKTFRTYNHSSYFSPSGKYLLNLLKVGISVVDFEADTTVLMLNGVSGYSFLFTPDEKYVVVGGENTINFYDISTGNIVRSKSFAPGDYFPYTPRKVRVMTFLPGGKQLFFHTYRLVGDSPRNETPEELSWIWDLEKDTLMISYFHPVFTFFKPTLTFSNDGTMMAYYEGRSNRVAKIIDWRTQKEIGYIPAPTEIQGIWAMAFSPDGRYLAYTILAKDGYSSTFIWDLNLQTNVYLFSGIYGYSLAFSPDGKYLALGHSVWLYDFEKIKRKIEAASAVPQEAPPLPVTIIYPNPTHDVIQLKFSLDAPLPTTINVLDLLGNNLKTIEDKLLEQGEHIFTIDLTNFSSGVYYLQVKAGNRLFNEKIVVSH
jgi:WD40 repeat protein